MKKIEELLYKMLFDKNSRALVIKEFQELVWNLEGNSKAVQILKELAYDLDYYEPNPKIRYEEDTYYGDERLEKEIEETLDKLKSNTV